MVCASSTEGRKLVVFGAEFAQECIAATINVLALRYPAEAAGISYCRNAEIAMAQLDDGPVDGVLVLIDAPHVPVVAAQHYEDIWLNQLRARAEHLVYATDLSQRASQSRTVCVRHARDPGWVAALLSLMDVTTCGESEVEDILADAAAPLDAALPSGAEDEPVPPEDEEQRLTDLAYLEPMRRHLLFGNPLTITWRPRLFFNGDEPGKSMPAVLEVAGRARILCYGPYMPLPVGKWTATATIGFSPDINGLPFIIEFQANNVTRGFFRAENGGIYSIEMTFVVEKSLTPVEIRLISQESALEGQVALIDLMFSYSNDA
jgi:hypothetical protein